MKTMHTIKPIDKKVFLIWINRLGDIRKVIFGNNLTLGALRYRQVVSLDAVLAIHSEMRKDCERRDSIRHEELARMADHIMAFEADGEPLSVVDGDELMAEWRQEHRPRRLLREFGDYGVQHPGKKRNVGHYFRRIKTTGELKSVAGVLKDEGEPEFRGRRRVLPNAWDDIKIMSVNDRSWKKYRKTRWREN